MLRRMHDCFRDFRAWLPLFLPEKEQCMKLLSALVIPVVMLLVCAMLTFSKKAGFDDFLLGTNEGLVTCVKLLPTLIALLVAVSMLSASGFLDFAARLVSPLAVRLGIPADILPLVLTRPVSGSASSALLAELYHRCGADSFAARVASVIAASGDTVLYISAVYFGSVGIKKTRHTLLSALLTMIFCVFLSSVVCSLLF